MSWMFWLVGISGMRCEERGQRVRLRPRTLPRGSWIVLCEVAPCAWLVSGSLCMHASTRGMRFQSSASQKRHVTAASFYEAVWTATRALVLQYSYYGTMGAR